MKKVAFLYPGQGSQRVGMGKDLVELYPLSRDIFNQAKQILGLDVEKLCVGGPEEELNSTSNLQPSLLTINWILTRLVKEKGITPRVAAGHSVGEYSALLATRVVDFPTALNIVKKRAHLMQEAGENKKGAMAAVIGLNTEKIINICGEARQVKVVNFNCPGQVVISGLKEEVLAVIKKLKNRGARKAVLLPVSGAFHSPLMRKAAEKFSSFLDDFSFNDPLFPVVSNATGNYATSARQIKDNLKLQMDHPVLWEKSMRLLVNDGFNIFVEVGPGKVLQGLMKRINREVYITGVGDASSIDRLTI